MPRRHHHHAVHNSTAWTPKQRRSWCLSQTTTQLQPRALVAALLDNPHSRVPRATTSPQFSARRRGQHVRLGRDRHGWTIPRSVSSCIFCIPPSTQREGPSFRRRGESRVPLARGQGIRHRGVVAHLFPWPSLLVGSFLFFGPPSAQEPACDALCVCAAAATEARLTFFVCGTRQRPTGRWCVC